MTKKKEGGTRHASAPKKGMPELKVEVVSIEDLIPYANNAKQHPPEQVAQIAASIQEFGFNDPIAVDETNTIIEGHGRLLAARKLGLSEIPIVRLDHLSPAQKKAYIIAHNKTTMNSGFDADMLKVEFEALKELDFDLSLTGFDLVEVDEYFKGLDTPEPEADPDEVPEAPEQPFTQLGDIYEIGPHRLMCGDSTVLEDVEKLMAGQKADMVFTDPPYGMSYGGGRARGEHARNKKGGVLIKAHGQIIGDDKRGEDLVALVRDTIGNAKTVSHPDAAMYICFPWRTYSEFLQGVRDCGLEPKGCIVWDKKSIGLGTAHYRPQHEFIFYCPGEKWNGGKDQSDVWTLTRGNTGEYVHPTQKPIDLVAKAIINSSDKGDIVLDVFGGSGSTMVAAHQTGRKAFLMELSPHYCDVIVARMKRLWPDIEVKRNGEPV